VSALLDVQGVQSRTFGERGVARYLTELAAALEQWFPESVERYLVNPDLPVAAVLERLPPTGRIASVGEPIPGASAYHVGSPFEREVSLDGIWPRGVRSLPLVVTLYDLIPAQFPEIYLVDALTRRWYRNRLEFVRRADRILAISRATARDAVERLAVSAHRLTVVGAAPAARFRPPSSPESALAAVQGSFAEIAAGFVLYTGGIEPRKNIDRLLHAYAGLPEELRSRHQLVIVCRVLPAERAELNTTLHRLGIAERVVLTGHVTDDQLVALYGAAKLFVFPSLYEGYGLPVAEAVACGTPVVAADTSSLVELVRLPEARFDPTDVEAIRAAIARPLTDRRLLEKLQQREAYNVDTWREVAGRTAEAYEEVAAVPRVARPRRRRPRIAYVSPLPPQRSGVADYSYRLLEPLAELCDVDAFVDRTLGEQRAPDGVHVGAIGHFDVVERLRGGYDRVLICLGNSEHHVGALDLLRRRGGTVLAHDVRLSGMYAFAAAYRSELEPRTLTEIVDDLYDGRVPAALAESGGLDPEEPSNRDVLLAREAIAASEAFVVHSEHAAQLARAEAAPADRHKIRVAPFAFRDPDDFPPREEPASPPLVATFGVVGRVKQTDKLIDAFALLASRCDCALLVAGPPAGPGEYERLQARVDRLGLARRVRLRGFVDGEGFDRLITQTTVAVQLRTVSMGETSGSVADCLGAGIPTIASAVGSTRELPDDVLVKVEPDVSAAALADELEALLGDDRRRADLGHAARAHAREHPFAESARFLYEELVRPARAADASCSSGARASATTA
jgi:glycosyltransferase involved in cell wall biosynthesis